MEQDLSACADALREAYATRAMPSWDSLQRPPATVAEAYAVQEAVSANCGLTPAGWKLGCTSEASQRNLGSEGPIAGRMFAERLFTSGATLSDVRFDMLLVEAEFAFTLAADLPARSSPYTEAEVLAALGQLHPAIELVQSRFADIRLPILGIVTDNAGAGSLILGPAINNWRDRDLAAQAVALRGPDGVIASGHGADVLGNPINAMVWLANFLSQRGLGLKRDEVVTTGTCFAPPKLEADITVTADFGDLGACEVHFVRP